MTLGFYAGSGTLKNQLEILEGRDCVWFSPKSSGVGKAVSAEQPYPWNPSCLESTLPLEHGIRAWLGLEGTSKGSAMSRDTSSPSRLLSTPSKRGFHLEFHR